MVYICVRYVCGCFSGKFMYMKIYQQGEFIVVLFKWNEKFYFVQHGADEKNIYMLSFLPDVEK